MHKTPPKTHGYPGSNPIDGVSSTVLPTDFSTPDGPLYGIINKSTPATDLTELFEKIRSEKE